MTMEGIASTGDGRRECRKVPAEGVRALGQVASKGTAGTAAPALGRGSCKGRSDPAVDKKDVGAPAQAVVPEAVPWASGAPVDRVVGQEVSIGRSFAVGLEGHQLGVGMIHQSPGTETGLSVPAEGPEGDYTPDMDLSGSGRSEPDLRTNSCTGSSVEVGFPAVSPAADTADMAVASTAGPVVGPVAEAVEQVSGTMAAEASSIPAYAGSLSQEPVGPPPALGEARRRRTEPWDIRTACRSCPFRWGDDRI